MLAWHLGHDISGKEQTIGFQAKHTDKLHTMYKAEGDGMLCAKVGSHGHFIFAINQH